MHNATANFDTPDEMLMTTSRAARLLGVSEQMVRVLANQAQLPCSRISGMRIFSRRDVLHLLEQRSADLG